MEELIYITLINLIPGVSLTVEAGIIKWMPGAPF